MRILDYVVRLDPTLPPNVATVVRRDGCIVGVVLFAQQEWSDRDALPIRDPDDDD